MSQTASLVQNVVSYVRGTLSQLHNDDDVEDHDGQGDDRSEYGDEAQEAHKLSDDRSTIPLSNTEMRVDHREPMQIMPVEERHTEAPVMATQHGGVPSLQIVHASPLSRPLEEHHRQEHPAESQYRGDHSAGGHAGGHAIGSHTVPGPAAASVGAAVGISVGTPDGDELSSDVSPMERHEKGGRYEVKQSEGNQYGEDHSVENHLGGERFGEEQPEKRHLVEDQNRHHYLSTWGKVISDQIRIGGNRYKEDHSMENHLDGEQSGGEHAESDQFEEGHFVEDQKYWHHYPSTRGNVISGRFRILELHSGRWEDNLSGALVLEGAAAYEALSYVWGSEEKSVPLYSARDPLRESVCVLVTPSLASALRHLRFESRSRYLWVDALCINQDDDDEKSCQVPIMSDIYYDAKNVCVWLGESDENSTLAFGFISKLLDMGAFDQLSRGNQSFEEWKALSALMCRPWFTRRWVVQEISRSRNATIHCGLDQARWHDFADVITLVENSPRSIPQILHEAQGLTSLSETFKILGASRLVEAAQTTFVQVDDGPAPYPVLTLEALMSLLVPFKVSDPRDIVYSILSLAKDARATKPVIRKPLREKMVNLFLSTSRPGTRDPGIGTRQRLLKLASQPKEIQVDYRKDPLTVFKDFVGFVIRQSKSLDVICRPWAPDDIQHLPSWIPKLSRAAYLISSNGFHYRKNADSLAEDPYQGIRTYHASGSETPQINLTEDPLGLEVLGFVVDQVEEVGNPALDGTIPLEWVSLGSWKSLDTPPPSSFWRTLVANRGKDGRFPPQYYRKACQYVFRVNGQHSVLNTSQLLERSLGLMVENFLRRVQMVVWNRRLIRTKENKLLGLCPDTAQKGDMICILYGCSIPVIIRKVLVEDDLALSSAQYHLIGECYIHELMEGEAMLKLELGLTPTYEEHFLIV